MKGIESAGGGAAAGSDAAAAGGGIVAGAPATGGGVSGTGLELAQAALKAPNRTRPVKPGTKARVKDNRPGGLGIFGGWKGQANHGRHSDRKWDNPFRSIISGLYVFR